MGEPVAVLDPTDVVLQIRAAVRAAEELRHMSTRHAPSHDDMDCDWLYDAPHITRLETQVREILKQLAALKQHPQFAKLDAATREKAIPEAEEKLLTSLEYAQWFHKTFRC